MRFIVDEQLPNSLATWLHDQGYEAERMSALKDGTRITDNEIISKSMQEKSIVISKDSDFFQRFLIKKEPHKLLYITTGNIKNSELLQLFSKNFESIVLDLQKHSVVEMNATRIIVHH